jgi:CheY-like chemotaxis protein
LEFLDKDQFDVILMDIQMPVMDGMEATKIIREELKLNIPIIALTANAIKGSERKYYEVGMNEYLFKPFEATSLVKKISLLLNKKVQEEANEEVTTKKKSAATEGKLYSIEKLEENCGGNKEFMKTMIEIFISQTSEILNQIQYHIVQKEYDPIKKLAHKLKASVGMLGITVLIPLVKTVELYEQPEENPEDFIQHAKELNETGFRVIDQLSSEL